MMMENKFVPKTEDEIIAEVAEEEGLTKEEVKEMWESFKNKVKEYEEELNRIKRNTTTKHKKDKKKIKWKRKSVRKSRKKNRK